MLTFLIYSISTDSVMTATNNDGGTQPNSVAVWGAPAAGPRNTQAAVSVRHAFKAYGKKKNANQVLNNLNMTVPKGTM